GCQIGCRADGDGTGSSVVARDRIVVSAADGARDRDRTRSVGAGNRRRASRYGEGVVIGYTSIDLRQRAAEVVGGEGERRARTRAAIVAGMVRGHRHRSEAG